MASIQRVLKVSLGNVHSTFNHLCIHTQLNGRLFGVMSLGPAFPEAMSLLTASTFPLRQASTMAEEGSIVLLILMLYDISPQNGKRLRLIVKLNVLYPSGNGRRILRTMISDALDSIPKTITPVCMPLLTQWFYERAHVRLNSRLPTDCASLDPKRFCAAAISSISSTGCVGSSRHCVATSLRVSMICGWVWCAMAALPRISSCKLLLWLRVVELTSS